MPRLTLDQLQTIEALTGKHHSIVNGRQRKTRRTQYQSWLIGLPIPTDPWNPGSEQDQLQVLVRIHEDLLGIEHTNYESLLKLQLIMKR